MLYRKILVLFLLLFSLMLFTLRIQLPAAEGHLSWIPWRIALLKNYLCLWFTFMMQRFAFPGYPRDLHHLGIDLKTPIHSMLISVYTLYIFNACNMFSLLHCMNMHCKYNSTIYCHPEEHGFAFKSQDFFLVISGRFSLQVSLLHMDLCNRLYGDNVYCKKPYTISTEKKKYNMST